MRMDMFFFLGYDIEQALPWHSTLSRTRNLFGEEVFLELFRKVLCLCVASGMVDGRRQAVDSAFIQANASMSSLVEKQIQEESSDYYRQLSENSQETNKEISKDKLKHSDKFISKSDPDARLSQKQGKVPCLNYLGQISVDTESHVICGAGADFADKKDSDCIEIIVGQAAENLKQNGIQVDEVLADAGYSSGSSLKYLEEAGITSYISPHSWLQARKGRFYIR